MKDQLKNIYQNIKPFILNRGFNKDAEFYLKNLEKKKGKLDKKLINKCDEYSIEILKSKSYAPWLYVYTIMHENFKEGWIPDNYFALEILPKINGSYGRIASLRPLNKKIFNNSSLFSDLVYVTNGQFYDASNLNRLEYKQVKTLLSSHSENIVFKKNDSAKGKGIIFINGQNDLDSINPELFKDGLFQPLIKQNHFFAQFNKAVATLRVTSFINLKGECEIKFCDLRLPMGDVTHVYDGSYIRIPVNHISGELSNLGYDTFWNTLEKHPFTDISYQSLSIPKFLDIVQKVKELHLMYPLARIIGWDIIIDENENIQILEWNATHPGIKFAEATVGPCFKSSDF